MKKDKMQVQKRSSKMRNFSNLADFLSSFNIVTNNITKALEGVKNTTYSTVTNNIKKVENNITYSIVPTIKRNDGVIDNQLGIVVTKDFTYGFIYIEINRRYNCGVFGFSACKYDLDLDIDENRSKVQFFNLSEFGEDENFTINFFEYQGISNNYKKYIYKMDADYSNNKGQVRKLIDILNKLAISNSDQITKSTDNTTYNIKVPFREFIFATPSAPFKPVMIKSQKLHHVLTVDQTDNVFYFMVVDEVRSEYRVSMIRPIEIFHDVSSTIPSRQWSGYILVTIDMNWNITMKFVTGDGWDPNNQWIYGRLWFASGNDKVESGANLSGESEYDETFTNPNDNNRGYTDTVVTTHKLKAFRNIRESQKIVIAEIKQNSNTNMKLFKDSNNNEPHYIKEGDDEIYVLRYQGRIEGYYGGERQTFPSMSIDISGDIKVKLPGKFKNGSGYKFLTVNYAGYIKDAFFGYNHINKSYYNLYGQNSNMLYLNENDIEYEKDIQSGIWYVGLKNKIQFTHTYSVIDVDDGDKTLINYILEIDEKWNMSLSLDVSFDKEESKPWLYVKMILETDTHDNKFINNSIVGTINRTIYKGDDVGIGRGRIYSFRPCGDGFNRTCDKISRKSITQNNNTVKYTIKNKIYDAALPVTNLIDFIRIDSNIIPYGIGDTTAGSFDSTTGFSYIDRIVKIGIQEQKPYSTIPIPIYTISDQIFEINIPTWECGVDNQTLMQNAVVNISKALNYNRNEDGSFNVTITRPIRINYTANIYWKKKRDNTVVIKANTIGTKVGMEYITVVWKIIITIEIDKYWNVKYRYTTPDDAWYAPNLRNKNIQGYMRICINDANNSQVFLKNPTDNVDSVVLYNGSYVRHLDTYRFIGWADETGLTANVDYSNNNPIKTFTSLSNMIRFDANFAAYRFTYNNDYAITPNGGEPYIDSYRDRLLENTITLCGITYT
jgi:hypothetical protein